MTRYEILIELRESYKQRKTANTKLLPQEADTFSNFQMAKLLKKRNLQVEIDNIITEMNAEIVKDNIEDIKNSLKIDPELITSSSSQIFTGTLASDENTRCVLIKKLNQAINEFNVSDDDENEDTLNDIKEENDSQEQIYKLPNSLPGQSSEVVTYADRIEFFSNVSQSFDNKFSAKKLSTNINKNFAKYSSQSNLKETKLELSDNEETSTEDDDFIEVENNEINSNQLNLFDECVPYDTNYTIKIHVNESPKNEIQEEKINKNVDEIEIQDNADEISIEKSDNDRNNESHPSTTVDAVTPNNLLNPVSSEPLNIEPLIKASKESIKLNRQTNSVTKQMIIECQELLRLFGIPWIVAPAEAEAQCAILEELNLSDGTITDDSDIFLFGGKKVYKNFFNNSKHIFCYKMDDLKKFYGLDRSKLICLGMLCGTDYTVGIEGIGPVTGLEILSQFPGDGIKSLEKFADWHKKKMKKNYGPENAVRQKFLKYVLPPTFPSRMVFDAYNNANVDNSTQPFSWAMPQLSELTIYARERFGWSEAKSNAFLLPVLKNLNAKQVRNLFGMENSNH